MKIIKITDKKQFNNFIGGEKHAQFLQSWQWGEFQKEVSGPIFKVGVVGYDDGKLIASASLVKKELPMGRSYFYCGRGPVIAKSEMAEAKDILDFLFNEIEIISKQEGIMFLRFEPTFDFGLSPLRPSYGGQATLDFQLSKTIDVQPSKTLILNLTKSEDEILQAMHQKTRYNIRLAEKKGVKIVEAGVDRFEEFWQILTSTGDRDNFNLHGRSYYKTMLNGDNNFVKLFFAEYQNKTLASNLVIFFGDTVTYVHGGSSNENRELMAPYAMQWQTIKLAKKLGYKYYDWYGIDEKKWPGVTRFKLGFSGKTVEYPGTFDLIYDEAWYNIYKMVRKVRRTF